MQVLKKKVDSLMATGKLVVVDQELIKVHIWPSLNAR